MSTTLNSPDVGGFDPTPLSDDKRRGVEKLLDTMPTHLIDLREGKFKLVHTASLLDDDAISKALQTDWSGKELPSEISALFDYAILSHRWGKQEPNYKTIVEKGVPSHERQSEDLSDGDYKLMKFCQTAQTRKIPFAWSDTCCINKESSAELQEAINSMFAWYYNAKLCIVHLGRTTGEGDLAADPWFKRGWTLQELLAPRCTKFYNKDWVQLVKGDNDKSNDTLLNALSAASNIQKESITRFEPGVQDVRERMLWASERRTTRTEDMAYSLLGIFKINMAIKYGEKEHAFFRLQEEIMKQTKKTHIFDWNGEPSEGNTMLASQPSCFLPEPKYPRYTPWQIIKFYSTTLLFLFTYDLCVVCQDFLISFTVGEIANVGKIGHSITNRGIRTKFQLYNVARITPVVDGPKDGYNVYDVKANALKTLRVETKTKLEMWIPGICRPLIPTGLTEYRIAIINGWTIGGFTGMHTKKCVAILLQKDSLLDPYNFVRIPTRQPLLAQRNRNKWLVPETVYIK